MPASTATGKRRPTHDQDASRIPDREPSREHRATPHRNTHASSHASTKREPRRHLIDAIDHVEDGLHGRVETTKIALRPRGASSDRQAGVAHA